MTKISPIVAAGGALIAGLCLLVTGIYVLVGLGWALVAAAVPCLMFAGVIFRGLLRG